VYNGEVKEKKHNFFKGFLYAGAGLKHGLGEFNLRVHILVAVLVVILGVVFHLEKAEWLAIILCLTLVPSLELINSAIEEVCDKLRDDLGLAYEATKHPRDLAAGAVLWGAVGSAVVGVIIFLPKIIYLCTAVF
jgi:diacylglycerol kinase